MTQSQTLLKHCLLVAAIASLSACGGSDQSDLRAWMQEQRQKTPASIEKINPPVEFVPAPYTQSGMAEPFDSSKLKAALAKAKSANATGIQPDLSRKREALEGFPLDSVRMVGFVLKQGKPIAMVATPTALYNLALGQYLGPDFGKVIAITEQEITIKELVQDGSGAWAERLTKIPLMVAGKEIKK